MESSALLYYGALLPSILAAITCHEYAHARVALLLGDPTAQEQGRVSLNPLSHLDPLGALSFLLVGFGWGKPVPVNRARLRHPRSDFFVSAAGPSTNLLLAFLAAQLFKIPALWDRLTIAGLASNAQVLGLVFIHINLVLGLFNLLPIHPLDGSHVVQNLLPRSQASRFERLNRSYGPILLVLLFASGYVLPVSPLGAVLGPAVQFLKALFLGA
ncbi:MAG: hypothetical protein A3B78_02590 [Omnitrophica WOR_2 bacterium RIFCSPHIGHO2_02_FULL_67_20]|nr:MAG: hypothetical protein A3B78_02590 [Omnitrophica WOR_2 bacterium RIFCSPHIGHO2_02_FULL_67_20]